ncbi:MAG: sodium:solute symporter, partial [Verrucomicrobiota bacterium]|nr:sodium:solute symporter [Verrucomicrobiota bacterium]
LGLFLLGLISRKADNAGALAGVILGVLVICWMTFADYFPEEFRNPFHAHMIIVVGTLTIFLTGIGISRWRSSGG